MTFLAGMALTFFAVLLRGRDLSYEVVASNAFHHRFACDLHGADGSRVEIEVLRDARIGSTFLFVLAFVVILTAACAALVLGVTYSTREIAGLMIIVSGMTMAAWPSGAILDEDAALISAADPMADKRSRSGDTFPSFGD